MKHLVILLAALVAVTLAQQQSGSTPIPIIRQSQEGPNPDGSYKWSYEAGNGIAAEEEGHVKNAGSDNEAMEAVGQFSYTDPEGNKIQLEYIANEEGFQPKGAHLPTPPPIPPEILKALEWNAAHPEEDNIDSPK
ncbi:endocuticle structural glycoprotein SgAbd-8-like [Leptopilina boulardi]|uniref:endocuticle structural glycoprotein SgAbd-8-like n=1 Tax=Leptopilina boulardi TaxID=63433 RepID=UPI0021F5D74A|nr:endocuticle structural glycoprotein SgAbd-8-like [Leptopilina boulardi]